MKQYTTPEQTAKLIELGFEKPNVRVDTIISTLNGLRQGALTIINDFSIGELIEILPDFINIWDLTDFNANKKIWNVGYAFSPTISRPELIDALFDMVVKLKEEDVI